MPVKGIVNVSCGKLNVGVLGNLAELRAGHAFWLQNWPLKHA